MRHSDLFMSPQSDEDLMLAAGRGDRRAFALLIERHQQTVFHFIQRFLAYDLHAAEDVAQDVFLSAWKSAPGYRPTAKVLTWLLRIATNAALNHVRARRTRQRLLPQAGQNEGEPVSASAAEGADDRERGAAMRAAIASLPESQRAAIILRHFHELSYVQIADVLDVSHSAVESLLFRARENLRQRLESGLPE